MDSNSTKEKYKEDLKRMILLDIYLEEHEKDFEGMPEFTNSSIRYSDPDSIWYKVNPVSGKRCIDEIEELSKRYSIKISFDTNEAGVSGWTVEVSDKPYSIMYNGLIHGELPSVIGKKKEDEAAQKVSYETDKLLMEIGEGLSKNAVGIGAHKTLCELTSSFTKSNSNGKVNTLTAKIDYQEYALKRGYDIVKHPMDTPEEEAAEAKRVRNAQKSFRKKINAELAVLHDYSVSWRMDPKSSIYDYRDVHIVQEKGISGGYIEVMFGNRFADYIVRCAQTYYPDALLSMDERDSNAYNAGWKMWTHYNNYNNIIKGTNNRLMVSTLLGYMSLPTLNFEDAETQKTQRLSWRNRIKEPFEEVLERVIKTGIFSNWQYAKTGGVPLTDEEANFSLYDDWTKALVKFEVSDEYKIDHSKRLEEKKAEKLKALEEQKKTKKKSDKKQK